MQAIVVAYARSGSSFLARLLTASDSSYFLYEPLLSYRHKLDGEEGMMFTYSAAARPTPSQY